MRPRVYISGPITKGDHVGNFAQAAEAQRELMDMGYAPFNPMLTMMFPGHEHTPHDIWMEVDIPWVAVADAVLRLPGESVGADLETGYAEEQGIPVFYGLDEVDLFFSVSFIWSEEWQINN